MLAYIISSTMAADYLVTTFGVIVLLSSLFCTELSGHSSDVIISLLYTLLCPKTNLLVYSE